MSLNRVTDLCRNVLMQGEGLRPVLRYARLKPVTAIRVDISVEDPTRYAVTFYFNGGAQCLTRWVSWTVLCEWILARRSWAPDRVRFAHRGTFEQVLEHGYDATLRKRGIEVAGPPAIAFAA
ncbi:hypothetical protein WYO_0146 [Methylobacterium sp. GXF4]|uniref:hypothetical protein n=1 Tax=Methylobacterium sp. GXF4 TaxID=1096546 RepID=UPI0002698C3B|nr:hypothetical protein [Methylobacterium sp. GXF4]EIZ87109.1 hypothetical protein WYO_0146 [Methylobacterium sp. GXF4]